MNLTKLALAIALLIPATSAFGQVVSPTLNTNDFQGLNVVVDESISIVAPGEMTIIHDLTDSDQVFPTQPWVVHTSSPFGAAVTLEVASPFVHDTHSSYMRDARMFLEVLASDTSASWVVSLPLAKTDYVSGNNSAVVKADSSGAGEGVLGLTVAFVETDASALVSGTYRTQVIGTISNN